MNAQAYCWQDQEGHLHRTEHKPRQEQTLFVCNASGRIILRLFPPEGDFKPAIQLVTQYFPFKASYLMLNATEVETLINELQTMLENLKTGMAFEIEEDEIEEDDVLP